MTQRIDRLRDVASSMGADGAIVTHPANRRYLSGFPPTDHAPDESAGVLVVSEQSAVLYVSPTNLPWAAASVVAPVEAKGWQRPWQPFIGQILQDLQVRRLLFEDRALTVADHAAILGTAGDIELVPASDAIHSLRVVKDTAELATIARAARLTDAALAAALSDLVPGMTERQLAWNIERAMHDLGADGPAFPSIVAAGPHGARPHHDPTDRPIREGEPVVIDIGASVDGYCGDLTRTVVVGTPPPIFVDRYNSVLAAQLAALEGVRAGMSGQQADAIARDALTAAGYGQQFIHGLGHGVGLLIHEAPSLGTTSEEILQPGNVLTIEPGIYLEEWGGIRIEDLAVVTPAGLDVLSCAPK